tara:strand:- start:1552 stop:1824 length:273 start_codon:yes stop_codon:yes gene_type:complete
MLKFRELYMNSTGEWALRNVSINPQYIVSIKENPSHEALVKESNNEISNNFNQFCTIVTVDQEMVVVGEINELRHHVKGYKKPGRTLLHG